MNLFTVETRDTDVENGLVETAEEQRVGQFRK